MAGGLAVKKVCPIREGEHLEQEKDQGEPRTPVMHDTQAGKRLHLPKTQKERRAREEPREKPRKNFREGMTAGVHIAEPEADEAVKSCLTWQREGHRGHCQSRFSGAKG